MYTIEQMEKDFKDGKLKEFVVNDGCNDTFKWASDFKGKTLKIIRINNRGGWIYYDYDRAIEFEYIDLEATQKLVKKNKKMFMRMAEIIKLNLKGENKMKFKKEDLNTRFVVELRSGETCFLSDNTDALRFFTSINSDIGISNLSVYNEELKDSSGMDHYDIIAIKEYHSTKDAYCNVINNTVEDWDWVSEEKTKSQIEYEQMQNDLKSLQDKMEKFANENNLA